MKRSDVQKAAVYTMLKSCAQNLELITYEEIEKKTGVSRKRELPRVLSDILHECQRRDLPPLTVLVVRKNSKLPGDEFWLEFNNNSRSADREQRFGKLVDEVFTHEQWPEVLAFIKGR